MVAEQTKCYDRGSIGKHCSGNNLNNRRLPAGLGGLLRTGSSSGHMVPATGTKLPYQCSRDVSSDGDDETPPYSDSGEACPDQVRQHDSSQLSQQARRYKISQSLPSNMAPLKWAKRLQCMITATHLAGVMNQKADFLSRHKILHTEWMLHPKLVQEIFRIWERPLIDLFAADQNQHSVLGIRARRLMCMTHSVWVGWI